MNENYPERPTIRVVIENESTKKKGRRRDYRRNYSQRPYYPEPRYYSEPRNNGRRWLPYHLWVLSCAGDVLWDAVRRIFMIIVATSIVVLNLVYLLLWLAQNSR
jgi:hypothetical protein